MPENAWLSVVLTEQEVVSAVKKGERFEAKFGTAGPGFAGTIYLKKSGVARIIETNRSKFMQFVRMTIGWLFQ